MYLQKGLSGCTALRMRNTRNYVIEQSMASEEWRSTDNWQSYFHCTDYVQSLVQWNRYPKPYCE